MKSFFLSIILLVLVGCGPSQLYRLEAELVETYYTQENALDEALVSDVSEHFRVIYQAIYEENLRQLEARNELSFDTVKIEDSKREQALNSIWDMFKLYQEKKTLVNQNYKDWYRLHYEGLDQWLNFGKE